MIKLCDWSIMSINRNHCSEERDMKAFVSESQSQNLFILGR